MIVNQSNLAGLTTGFNMAFNQSLKEAKEEYKAFATEIASSTAENAYKWLGTIPRLREWIGEREVQKLEAHGYTIRNRPFESTIAVDRDDIEDDQYGVYTPLFNNLGQMAGEFPDDLCFEQLTKGFKEKCYDGKTFFNAQHKINKKEVSNTTSKKFSRDAYKEGRAQIMSLTDEDGRPLNLVPDLLIVGPKYEEEARLLLEADQIEGTTNVYKGTAKLMVSTRLAGEGKEDMWFLLCTSRFLKPIIFQKRKPIQLVQLTKTDDLNVFMKKEFLYGADGRANAGFGFWQMAYGGSGTAA